MESQMPSGIEEEKWVELSGSDDTWMRAVRAKVLTSFVREVDQGEAQVITGLPVPEPEGMDPVKRVTAQYKVERTKELDHLLMKKVLLHVP